MVEATIPEATPHNQLLDVVAQQWLDDGHNIHCCGPETDPSAAPSEISYNVNGEVQLRELDDASAIHEEASALHKAESAAHENAAAVREDELPRIVSTRSVQGHPPSDSYSYPDRLSTANTFHFRPRRLGSALFADQEGNVFDFAQVKAFNFTEWLQRSSYDRGFEEQFRDFDCTPELVAGWGTRSSSLSNLDLQYLLKILSSVSYPFSTWYDSRFDKRVLPGQRIGTNVPLETSRKPRTHGLQSSRLSGYKSLLARRLGLLSAKSTVVKHPAVSLATILFIWMQVHRDATTAESQPEYAVAMQVLYINSFHIRREICDPRLRRLLDPNFVELLFKREQDYLYTRGLLASPTSFATITFFLVNSVFETRSADITPQGIRFKITRLFQLLPRVHDDNLRFYAVRCAIVYGSLAVFECRARDRRARRYKLASALVTDASEAIANIPTVNGVPVGKMIEPAATAVRGGLNSFFKQKQKHYSTGVSNVLNMFVLDVLGEATEGLLASYPPGAVERDADGNPLPAFSPSQLTVFKQSAWQVFQVIMNDENCEITLELEKSLLLQPPKIVHARWPTKLTGTVYPRISSDCEESRLLPIMLHVQPAATRPDTPPPDEYGFPGVTNENQASARAITTYLRTTTPEDGEALEEFGDDATSFHTADDFDNENGMENGVIHGEP